MIQEGDILYACINSIPVQCKITAVDFGGSGTHLVYTIPENQAYLVSSEDLAENSEQCLANFTERVEKEYKMYSDLVDSPTALILHILYAAVNGKKIDGIEKTAIIDQASKYTQIDVNEYLSKLAEIEKGKRNKNENQEED